MADFVHLHLHSEYSLLDGAIQFEQLVPHLRKNGMSAAAVSDHGALFGAIHFHDKMTEHDLKPIIGFEAYITHANMTDRSQEAIGMPYYHLTLLARNEKGYRNLCRLSSMAFLEGMYRKPRIDREILSKHSEGLLIGSACLQGEIAQFLLGDREEDARNTVRFYQDIVGLDNYFIELMDHGLEEEKRILGSLVELAHRTGTTVAATNDAHYLNKDDARSHEILLCLQTGRTMSDENRMRFGSEEFYVKTPREMEVLFSWCPESVTNTVALAEKCEPSIEKGSFLLPSFDLPDGETNLDEYLNRLSFEGLENRLHRTLATEEAERLTHELGIISDMGFPAYFLIVSELMRWARSEGIPVGPGRGSSAGSLVSYAIDITDVNPLDFGLSFERFLNPARMEMPDIDLDVCYERRGEVIDHIIERYGREKVCQIISFNRMKNRSAVRDVARVSGLSFDEGDRLAKLVAQAQDPDAPLADVVKAVPELSKMAANDPDIRQVLEHAGRLGNIVRHSGVHAAGVVIAPGDLLDCTPLHRSRDKGITTQFEKKSAEKIGLLKLDVLGLRTATVIHHATEMARRRDPSFDIESIPFDDPGTLELLSRGETTAVFQLESSGMREALRKIGVDRFDDVTAAVAIFRPGSMHMIDMYAENKQRALRNDPDDLVNYLHPELQKILHQTYGVIIYQEQVMRIANEFAGMSMTEADTLRRAMSRKDPEVMARIRTAFTDGAVSRGISNGTATEVFNHIEKFAGYGFNKSHALCYSILSYRTAWLKRHYPAELMAASLSSETGNIDKLAILIDECRRLEVQVLPPSVNSSNTTFDVDSCGRVVYALSAVKNVGEGPSRAIVDARESGERFRDIFDLCARVENGAMNRKVLESLVLCGATDDLEGSRGQLLHSVEKAMEYGTRIRRYRDAGQMSLFASDSEAEEPVPAGLPECEDLAFEDKLENELDLLGFYLTGHPLERYQEELSSFTTAPLNATLGSTGRALTIGGRIAGIRTIGTRRGDMAFINVEDRCGNGTEVIAFSDVLANSKDLLQPGCMVLMDCEVTERKGEWRLSVTGVYSLSSARTLFNAGLRIEIGGGRVDFDTIGKVVELLRERPGSGPVILRIEHPSGWKVLAASRSIRVSPDDDLIEDLRGLLGPESVSLTRGSGLSA
jgi:DNA polymerase-3 subunit alpha